MKHFNKSILILAVLCLTSFPGRTQVLTDTLRNSFQKYFAPVFKDKKVKRVYYSFSFPQLDSMNFNSNGKVSSSKWTIDTFLVSHFYDVNGYYCWAFCLLTCTFISLFSSGSGQDEQ